MLLFCTVGRLKPPLSLYIFEEYNPYEIYGLISTQFKLTVPFAILKVSGKIFQAAFRDRKIPFNIHGVAFYRKKVSPSEVERK